MKYFLFECRSLLSGRFSSAFLISNLSWKRVFLSTFFCTKLKRTFKFSCLLDHRSISLGILAYVAGAKRGGRGGGRKARKRGKGREPLPLSPLPPPFSLFPYPLRLSTPATQAREYSCLTSPLAARDVSPWGTSTPQRQKFHTDDVNQCLCGNKSDNHRGPDVNLVDFMFPLVDYGKVLCSSANELQQNSNASFKEEYILRKLTFL